MPGVGSIWRHNKGAFYKVVGYSRHSEDPDQWLVTYRPIAGEGDAWTRAIICTEQNEWPGFLDSFEIPAFEGDPGWYRFKHVGGPRTWHDEQPPEPETPSREDLIELLDNVSAAAENMLTQFGSRMFAEDVRTRTETIQTARNLCDTLLRSHAA
ncbi:DUF1653 domain-containing protein [Methylobacterium sp. WL103]|nr:DUF1653 domain-containing protein [Methylobacterium sp. WL103]